jgi:hypothetical protein
MTDIQRTDFGMWVLLQDSLYPLVFGLRAPFSQSKISTSPAGEIRRKVFVVRTQLPLLKYHPSTALG